ncbi:hypothetical protein [Cellulophaga baltica]|uniref:hypothetical protein n=1 Tax=Cellulophaga baltica TaxID=76594 RepID=UPI002494E6D4|nr:hypothetical protein [Cellulophaga baltica]
MNFIKKIISLVFGIVLLSCNSEKADIESNIEVIKNKTKGLKLKESHLENQLDSLKERFDQEKANINKNYISKSYYKNVIYINSENLKKNTQSQILTLFKKLNLKQSQNVLNSIINNWMNLKEIDDLNFLFENKYRTTKFINLFFEEANIDYMISLLDENNSYDKSKLDLYLELFLDAGKELKNNDFVVLSKIYELSTEGYLERRDEINYLINQISTIDENSYSTHFNTSESKTNIKFIVYSFWARRYKEGNSGIVYSIMEKTQIKLTNKQ